MKWTVTTFLAVALLAAPVCAQEYATGQAARLVIGQKPFTAQEEGASATLLGSPAGVAFGGDSLVIADANRVGATPNNNRVMVYRDFRKLVPGVRDPFPQNDTRCPACVGKATTVLGQADFEKAEVRAASQSALSRPLGVAYNGRVLAVADTDNNRVLIWRSLPANNDAPADFVVGQADFTSRGATRAPNARSLRGPQGVWLDQADGLWVADTLNNRVLYFGPVTANNPEAKLAIGQPDLNTDRQTSIAQLPVVGPNALRAPTSVTTDGTRLFVADLGLSRVLIWNSIPTRSGQNADVVVGQPDMNEYLPNNTSKLCDSTGTDSSGRTLYPALCGRSMSMPRFALSDGVRLYISDSGNDRVLVYNRIPTENGATPDAVLGQPADNLNQASDSAEPERISSTDSFKTPGSLAWDGTTLYVADTFNRRVLAYSPADFHLPISAVRNAASPEVFAQGSIIFSGELKENDELTVKIGNEDVENSIKEYKLTVRKEENFESVIRRFVELLNAGGGDPYVLATSNIPFNAVVLRAREQGPAGNRVSLSTAVSPLTSTTLMTTSGSTLNGGQDAARVAPYSLVTIVGDNLADFTSPVQSLDKPLPTSLANTEVFFDGVRAPLVLVSPTRIITQVPVQATGSNSASAIIRTTRSDGRVTVSTPAAVRVIEQSPGVFDNPELPPAAGLAFHYSSSATGTVSVDGSARAGDEAIVIIRDREYKYRVQAGDTLTKVRDGLVALINASDPEVEAFGTGPFTRVRLRARVPGPVGNGIPIGGRSTDGAASNPLEGQVLMTAFNDSLCCANQAGAIITEDNPAVPGETIVVLAAGMGLVGPDDARDAMKNGQPYQGPFQNDVTEFVSSLAGGKTANVLYSGLRQGLVGVYEVHLELNADIPTNPQTAVTIAQSFQISNIFNIAVVNPKEER